MKRYPMILKGSSNMTLLRWIITRSIFKDYSNPKCKDGEILQADFLREFQRVRMSNISCSKRPTDKPNFNDNFRKFTVSESDSVYERILERFKLGILSELPDFYQNKMILQYEIPPSGKTKMVEEVEYRYVTSGIEWDRAREYGIERIRRNDRISREKAEEIFDKIYRYTDAIDIPTGIKKKVLVGSSGNILRYIGPSIPVLFGTYSNKELVLGRKFLLDRLNYLLAGVGIYSLPSVFLEMFNISYFKMDSDFVGHRFVIWDYIQVLGITDLTSIREISDNFFWILNTNAELWRREIS